MTILIFFQFSRKKTNKKKENKNQIELVAEATYGLHPYQFLEILNLKF